jgi:hypothetical protein
MKKIFLMSIFVLTVNFVRIDALDTVFAKGGTCLYKIFDEYNECLKAQQERINEETDNLSRTITLAEQRTHLNKIGCCAYWTFLACVEKAADEKCIKDRTDMEKYTEQLGSSVPLYICREEFPRGSDVCDSSYQFVFSTTLCVFSIIVMFLK